MGVGGDVMLWKRLGIGAAADFMPARANYGSPSSALISSLGATNANYGQLLFRQAFYDVNAVFAPVNTKRVSVHLEGGIGDAHTGFGINESGCVGVAVCSTAIQPIGSSNHFDLHVGVGIAVYVTEHVFVKPEFDLHYATGLTNLFNSNLVPAGMVWVGYTFGER